MDDLFAFAQSDAMALLLGGLWLISEALASIPAVKANSVFQVVAGVLARFKRPVVPIVAVVMVAAGFSACAALMSKAPLFCSLATSHDVDQISTAVIAQLPDGTDKDRAQQIVALSQFSTELGCEAVRAIDMQRTAAAP